MELSGKCGEGGDALSFVMKSDGIGFKEAFELLNAESGVGAAKPEEKPPQRHRDAEKAETRPVGSVPCSTEKSEAEYLERPSATITNRW
ncbi:MAG: hypothetical protein IPO41_13740 [Acidobacteria bacterium]|nr:hypothetical protein [Acidobacteriota bacterium]